jgi:hypothetical protein
MVRVLPLICCLAACTPQPDAGRSDDSPADGEDGSTGDTDTDDTDGTDDTDTDTDTDTDGTDVDTDTDTDTDPLRCNGHAALCDLRLDEVTLAGTHNSMSNADDGWWVPNQRHGITEQLDAGVRALLLDTHDYWGEPQLCHNWCDLGRQPLAEGLGEISDFLAANPGEVVVLIIQDGISADVTAGVFEDVGLVPHLWVRTPGAPMPTLGALVQADTRLVVSAENEGPPPDWYHHAWDLFMDTPYAFGATQDFSCEANRGDVSNPLFLVNHWLSTPAATEDGSAEANTAAVLGERARRCELEQGRRVNVLAVDFYDLGDLFTVVDELNGVGASGPAAP